jgi:hypothetical protein
MVMKSLVWRDANRREGGHKSHGRGKQQHNIGSRWPRGLEFPHPGVLLELVACKRERKFVTMGDLVKKIGFPLFV